MLKKVTFRVLCGCRGAASQFYSTSSVANTQKFLKIAIIGSPNAGKSTLVNSLVGNRVCAVSHVANTTRTQLNAVLTVDNTQLVFTDTPGTVSYMEGRRLNMHSSHLRSPRHATDSADMIAVVTDVGNRRTRNYIDEEVLKIIDEYINLPVVLVMNKIDRLKRKEELLYITSVLTSGRKKDEWGYLPYGGSDRISECFFTCAQTGEGNDQFINYLLSVAKPGEWEYSGDAYCDSSVEKLINEVFREKLLLMFGQEIPWKVKQETLMFDATEDMIRIHQKLLWPKKSQQRYVSTKENELKEACLKELEGVFDCPIILTLDISQKNKMTTDDLIYY